MDFFKEIEELHSKKRIKFLEINNHFFIYNVRDSLLTKTFAIPEKYQDEIIRVQGTPIKTLILHSTYECNFRCSHCYLQAGKAREEEMDSEELSRIVREFSKMGGLGVDISGGEALLKQGIEKVIQTARNQRLRTDVLSNAGELNPTQLRRIGQYIDAMTVGLDGLYDVNDRIRGQGTFNRIQKGLELILEQGIELAITTLITKESTPQLLTFPEFLEHYGVKNWSLVMPRTSGRFVAERQEVQEAEQAWKIAKQQGLLKRLQQETKPRGIKVILDHILVPGSKKLIEETSSDFVYKMYNKGRVCWDNTLTIMPNGDIKCCLFFDGQVYDNVKGKPLREVYESEKRQRALEEFKNFPIDECPFVETQNLERFSEKLN